MKIEIDKNDFGLLISYGFSLGVLFYSVVNIVLGAAGGFVSLISGLLSILLMGFISRQNPRLFTIFRKK